MVSLPEPRKMRRDTVYHPATNDDIPEFRLASSDESDSFSDEMNDELENARLPSDVDDDYAYEMPLTTWEKVKIKATRILPHVGLVILLLVYLFVGAAVFQRIEGPNEIITKNRELRTILGLRDQFKESVWNLTHNPDTFITRDTFDGLNQEYFERLVVEIFSAYRNQFITEKHLLNETDQLDNLWTYPNSVFFATTVITTIGYGHLVPTTHVGRMVCILFALIGIPLLLVTIADIGRFLSEFLNYAHLSIRAFIKNVRRQSRRLSHFRRKRPNSISGQSTATGTTVNAGSMNLNDLRDPTSLDEEDEEYNEEPKEPLRIPILMVLCVILSYTALGGLLFQKFEEWPYMEAFYFCFITMATIGFGDYVPTKQMYTFITLIYIIFGLALATMCIDTAGTHYIRKIHYVGTKMEDAKGVVMTGIHHSEHLLKHKGINIIKTAGGKIYRVRSRLLSKEQLDYLLKSSQYQQKNIIYEPLSPQVIKLVKDKKINVLPDDISESECRGGLFNPDYEKNYMKSFFSHVEKSPNRIRREVVPRNSLQKNDSTISLVAPFVLKESNI
ncbi:unnamed protein product [Bursaphelenchus okinawaensis]|uniref:Potassium channel domain-containing protein n=1 Tax=Bursaphelenchus okinawaensis TaxID=465554 RepID=A0A811KL98_9BILA|nr:unnamed protein product [Bursaphelenchus okinawaensis]CAG9106109.1 unnamed protein product [Bursaphelenchus okinawaensis]